MESLELIDKFYSSHVRFRKYSRKYSKYGLHIYA